MEIGEKLKKAREAKGLTLEAVEEETKIRRKYLQAMEEEQFQILPGPIYAKAFLKNYARFLNLEVNEIMEIYNRQLSEEPAPETTEKSAAQKVKVEVPGKPRYWLYLGVAVIIVGLAFSLYYGAMGLGLFHSDNKLSGGVNNGEPARTPLQTGEQTQAPSGQPQTTGQQPPAQVPGVNLVLNVKEKRSWMSVVADGANVFQGEVPAGQSKNFSAKERISVTLGNAGVVEVLYNGQNLGFLGGDGAVVSREFTPQQKG